VESIKIFSITKKLNNDLTTPMAAYLKLNERDAFFLESVEKGEVVGRYSMIGLDPLIKVQGYDDYMAFLQDGTKTMLDGDPLNQLNLFYKNITHIQQGETPIKNGFFGYFSWEVIGAIESIDIQRRSNLLFEFQIPKKLLVFDHAQQAIYITITTGYESDGAREIQDLLNKIDASMPSGIHSSIPKPSHIQWDDVSSNWTKEGFEDGVKTIQHHIKEGDIFQGVISQKFTVKSRKDSLSVYRALRHINPSPYMFYFNYGDVKIIGSSPEILVKAKGGVATVRPIAGTRRRTYDNEDALIDDLKHDEKEVAEHIMLVDLGRNDLGRVCQYDTVKISGLMSIEKYSHVIHMVTNVDGQLKDNMTPIDLFKATFPAGTVSGAPKIRAIEIINSVEPDPRHIYSGSVGYFNLDGDMDFCIAIRSIIADENGYTVQAGAGVVNDSIPENEYNETKNKAQGVLMACFDEEAI
jgi:anthranilate synthase component 1